MIRAITSGFNQVINVIRNCINSLTSRIRSVFNRTFSSISAGIAEAATTASEAGRQGMRGRFNLANKGVDSAESTLLRSEEQIDKRLRILFARSDEQEARLDAVMNALCRDRF